MPFETGNPEAATSDAILIELTLNRDESAFAQLMQKYKRPVLNRIHRILGWSSEDDDAVQEIFLRAYIGLPRFDNSLSFRPWLMRIATNYCIDQTRRAKLHRVSVLSQMEEGERRRVDNAATHDPQAGCRPMRCPERWEELLGATMEGLQARYRAAIVLRDLEGREYSDVAKVLQVSLINARVMVSRARRMIRQEFRCRLQHEAYSGIL